MRYFALLQVISGFGVVCISNAAPALQFEQQSIAIFAKLGDTTVQAPFSFKNTSQDTITISRIVPGCSCTEYVLDKYVIKPGESGLLLSVVDLSRKVDDENIPIDVYTQGENKPVEVFINLKLERQPSGAAAPRFLLWHIGDNPAPKYVDFDLAPDVVDAIEGISVDGAGFDAQLKAGAGNHRIITISPKTTDEVHGVVVDLKLKPAFAKLGRFYRVFGYVMQAH